MIEKNIVLIVGQYRQKNMENNPIKLNDGIVIFVMKVINGIIQMSGQPIDSYGLRSGLLKGLV